MKKELLPKCLWAIVAFVFLLPGSFNELPAQDWSIKQLKNREHPILETTGQQFDFRDDVLDHLVAELKTEFIDDRLHLNILARSPRVAGYRSYRHVHGSNRLTSRVLRRMVDGVSSFELRDQAGSLISATLNSTEEKLPERRLNPDGSMNYLAMTQQEFIVQLEIVSAPLAQGSYQIDLFLESQLRLQIKFQVNASLQAVAFHSALHFVPQAQAQTEAESHSQEVPSKSKLDEPVDWQERDFEGKYFLLSQAIKHDITELPRWVDFLFEQKEYRLLGEIVLTQPGGFDCNNIGIRLAETSAPNWPQLAYWAETYRREHTNASTSVVINENKDVFYSWCHQNKIRISDQVEYEQQNVGQYWSKLDAKSVFAALKPPEKVTKFTGKKADKSKFYLQQFERAVLTTVNWDRTYQQRSNELLQLLKHPNDELRKQVLLAYTHLEPDSVPTDILLPLSNDPTQADSVRELATLSLSYGRSELVCDDINAIAAQMDHPGWKPAVSRLGDIGTGYDLKVLREQNPEDEMLQKLLQRSVKLIVDREAALLKIWQSDNEESNHPHVHARMLDANRKLSRLTKAHLQKRAHAEALQQWTNQYFKQIGKPGVVTKSLGETMKHVQKSGFTDQLDACIRNVTEELNR